MTMTLALIYLWMLASGVPLIQAVRFTRRAYGDRRFARRLGDANTLHAAEMLVLVGRAFTLFLGFLFLLGINSWWHYDPAIAGVTPSQSRIVATLALVAVLVPTSRLMTLVWYHYSAIQPAPPPTEAGVTAEAEVSDTPSEVPL